MERLSDIPKIGDPDRLKVLNENKLAIGARTAIHLVDKHKGEPSSTCHRCLVLNATFKDYVESIAMEEKRINRRKSKRWSIARLTRKI